MDAGQDAAPVRGTQSFVQTVSLCWHRPSLTALEIAWRWAFGIPTLVLLFHEAQRVLSVTPLDTAALQGMTVTDPMGAASTIADVATLLLPHVLHVAAWLAPLLVCVWVVVSSLGRTLVLRRADAQLHARPGTLMLLQVTRLLGLGTAFAAWLGCLWFDSKTAISGPLDRGQEPNLVLYFAIAIVATLGLFTLWAIVSWVFFAAPLLAMRLDLGAAASLGAALRLGELRSKLMEVNLVMGIVKIALVVLAMVFSATPLPFESIATPEFMQWWYAGVAIFYVAASDFFHVARLVGYLELWKKAGNPHKFPST